MLDQSIEKNRKRLNKRQTELRELLTASEPIDAGLKMLLDHHAQLHASNVASPEWSFEDAVLHDLTNDQIRHTPECQEHSVAWLLWHLARIEDIAMNVLVADSPQVFAVEGWCENLKIDLHHAGNAMTADERSAFSATVDVAQLKSYRAAVGRRSQEIFRTLKPVGLKQKVHPDRLQRVWDESALLEEASGIADYWSRRTIAGLLLMPATRHNIVHLNEALKLKRKL
jgi:hypothetical protein